MSHRAVLGLCVITPWMAACTRPAQKTGPAPAAVKTKPAPAAKPVPRGKAPPSKALELPSSSSRVKPHQAVEISVTGRAIRVEDQVVAEVKQGEVAPSIKHAGMTGRTVISPLLEALKKHKIRLKKIEAMTRGKMPFRGELVLLADRSVPFGLLAEVLYTADRAEFGLYRLGTLLQLRPGQRRADMARASITLRSSWSPAPSGGAYCDSDCREARAARRRARLAAQVSRMKVLKLLGDRGKKGKKRKQDRSGAGVPPPQGRLLYTLNITITHEGHLVPNSDGIVSATVDTNIVVRCKRLKGGRCARFTPATGTWRDDYDYALLTTLARKLKGKHAHDRQVYLTAAKDIPLQVVVRTLDAVRGEPTKKCTGADGCLFDQAVLSVEPR